MIGSQRSLRSTPPPCPRYPCPPQNVKLVVRLNKKYYDERKFINAGINHVEHYYLDGSVPPMRILKKVIAAIESAGDAAIAVHCKAGLGRAGTCTASWIMKVRLRGDEGMGEGRRGSSRGRA